MYVFGIILASLWGSVWALFLQWTREGQWLAERRTWLTVVVGVGMDLLIARIVIPRAAWERIIAIIAASAIPLVIRSLANERNIELERIRDDRKT